MNDFSVGSWVEIEAVDPELLQHVWSLGNVSAFILNQNLRDPLEGLPYYRFVTLKTWPAAQEVLENNDYRGAILRLRDTEIQESVLQLADVLSQVQFVELTCTNEKSCLVALEALKGFGLNLNCWLSPLTSLSNHRYNRLLEAVQKSSLLHPLRFPLRPYDLPHPEFQSWIELESFGPPAYQQNVNSGARYSVVIPHFENKHFVCNSLRHLAAADRSRELEVLVVDDGSTPKSLEYIQYFARKNCPDLSFQLFSWPKRFDFKNGNKVFRAGASRNWGAHYASTENLLFLDCDMLVPKSILSVLDDCFSRADVTQFKRIHIPPAESHEGVSYEEAQTANLYIEEESYWSQLFNAEDWMKLPDFWKYTCTYALAMKKGIFQKVGRIRRNFIQYGFEDTDLGYRLAKEGMTFRLEKTPLLHLTAKEENTNSWQYKHEKMRRIQPMAKVFYQLNQDPKIYESFQWFLA
ncbi:MAG: glycosyltransferase family A protein [Bdellovibrionales bacterium]